MPTPTIFEGINPRGTQTLIPCKDAKAQNGVIANTKLIKDTVGWSGKNKLKNTGVTSTIHNVTFTVNSDKSVTINGTASATIFFRIGQIQDKGSQILNGVTGGSFNTYGLTVRTADDQHPSFGEVNNYDGDTLFAVPSDYSNALYVNVRVPSGATVNNVTVYPMIRDDDILDDTYEPYFGSTAFPRSEQAVLGAKNLANLEYREMTNDSTFTESNGVYTIANNNGTSQYPSMKIFKTSAFGAFPAGKYTLSVNIVSFTNNTAVLAFRNASDNAILSSKALSVGKMSITYESAVPFTIGFLLRLGSTADTEIQFSEFMIALDNDLTYAPFAMTNKELTEKVLFNYQNITKNGLLISGSRQGNIVIISFYDGTNTEAYNSNDSLVGLSDFDKLFSASDTFAIQTEVLETYGKTARLYTVSGDIKTRSGISAGTVIRGTLVGVIK